MGLKPDHWITKMSREQRMIEPYEPGQVRQGVISYGVSSYGYDIRVADEYKIFTNVFSAVVDPKNFDPKSMVDYQGDVCVIPPNSFVLARTVEYFRIPRKVLTVCLGKCLTGDTRVVDASTGAYLPLSEMVAHRSPATAALSDQWRIEPRSVSAHLNNQVQAVFELTTGCGLKVKATAMHPFRTYRGWTPLNELRPGDRIAVARSVPIFGQADWPEHEAILLGLMLADGACHTPGSSPVYTTADPRLVQVMTEAARRFGVEISHDGRIGYRLVNRRGRGGIPERNRFYVWLESLGCNVRSAHKFVPQVVFTAKRERVADFLRALFSGDGSAYFSGDAAFIEYSSISERLILDVRHLLLRFGIFALVRSKKVADGSLAYRLQITDLDMIRRFADLIAFMPGCQKQANLDRLLAHFQGVSVRRSNFDTLPQAAWADMRETVYASGARSLRSVGIGRTQPDQSLPYKLARQAVVAAGAAPETSEFAAVVDSDVVWDTVESIVPCGEEVVYDLTVPDVHNFVANDIVLHNSSYARCGLIVNVTPFEPEWEGYVTLEISNTTPLPAKVYSNEGIAQVLFFEADEECAVSYADKKGKYQKQERIVLPRL